MTCRLSSALNNDPNDEDAGVYDDGVFAGDDLGQETAVYCAQPSTELEDRSEPPLLRLVACVISHVVTEGIHGKYTREDALVVAIPITISKS